MSAEFLSAPDADALLGRVVTYLAEPALVAARLEHVGIDTGDDGRPLAWLRFLADQQETIDIACQSSEREFTTSPGSWRTFDEGAVGVEFRKVPPGTLRLTESSPYPTPNPVIAINALRRVVASMPTQMRICRMGGPNSGSALGFYNPWIDIERQFWCIDAEVPQVTPDIQSYLSRHNAVRRPPNTGSVQYYSLASDAPGNSGTRFIYRTNLDLYTSEPAD